MAKPIPAVQCQISEGFSRWLGDQDGSLLLTAGTDDRVFLIGWNDGCVSVVSHAFDCPTALAGANGTYWLTVRDQVVLFQNSPPLAATVPRHSAGRYDALFLVRVRYFTGDIDAHDIGIGADGPWIAATRFDCLVRLSNRFNFEQAWTPPFVNGEGPRDRCHLNGLAMIEGHPAFVTARGATNNRNDWLASQLNGGLIISVPDNAIVLDGLCMPHSPRWHDGQLWFLNSGCGELCQADFKSGRAEVVCGLPAYLRGLCFVGPFALVGMNLIREDGMFLGLPVHSRYQQIDCGVAVIDLRSGSVVGTLKFVSDIREIAGVSWLPGSRRPLMVDALDRIQQEAVCTPRFSGWFKHAKSGRQPDTEESPGDK